MNDFKDLFKSFLDNERKQSLKKRGLGHLLIENEAEFGEQVQDAPEYDVYYTEYLKRLNKHVDDLKIFNHESCSSCGTEDFWPYIYDIEKSIKVLDSPKYATVEVIRIPNVIHSSLAKFKSRLADLGTIDGHENYQRFNDLIDNIREALYNFSGQMSDSSMRERN